jgi:hypothetical protein
MEVANQIFGLLEKGPLVAVLALALLAGVHLFRLLQAEQKAHLETVKTIVALAGAISAQWNKQLELAERTNEKLNDIEPALLQSQRRLP